MKIWNSISNLSFFLLANSVQKSSKVSPLSFSIWAFSTNFCPIQILTCLVTLSDHKPQVFLTFWWDVDETFPAIFKHRVVYEKWRSSFYVFSLLRKVIYIQWWWHKGGSNFRWMTKAHQRALDIFEILDSILWLIHSIERRDAIKRLVC